MDEHKTQNETTGKSVGVNDHGTPSTEALQQNNATGDGENEQGQASFVTGSTTGGGSNFGQGSSHLGGESYQQGDKTGAGSNYGNETDSLGASSTGTSNEGSSDAASGAAQSGNSENADQSARTAGGDRIDSDDRGKAATDAPKPSEGDRRDTSLENDSSLGTDNAGDGKAQTGSWSSSSAGNDS